MNGCIVPGFAGSLRTHAMPRGGNSSVLRIFVRKFVPRSHAEQPCVLQKEQGCYE